MKKLLESYLFEVLLNEQSSQKIVKLLKTYLKHPDSNEGKTALNIAKKISAKSSEDFDSLLQIAKNELTGVYASDERHDPNFVDWQDLNTSDHMKDYFKSRKEQEKVHKPLDKGTWIKLKEPWYQYEYAVVLEHIEGLLYFLLLVSEDSEDKLDFNFNEFDVVSQNQVPESIVKRSQEIKW